MPRPLTQIAPSDHRKLREKLRTYVDGRYYYFLLGTKELVERSVAFEVLYTRGLVNEETEEIQAADVQGLTAISGDSRVPEPSVTDTPRHAGRPKTVRVWSSKGKTYFGKPTGNKKVR